MGLWLVARECLRQPARAALGQRLAERAVAAAQRQIDHGQLSAILFEHGKLQLEAGDRPAAEKMWSELLTRAVVEPRQPKARSATTVANANNPAATAAAPPADKSAATPTMPATLSQFKLAAAIAQTAAEHDLPDLSLRAMRDALSGGLPVPDPSATGSLASGSRIIRSVPSASSSAGVDSATVAELSQTMWKLSRTWQERQFPADQVYDLLAAIVFPANRPEDVLLFEQSLEQNLTNPRSLGKLLAQWAVVAGRVSELEQAVAARQTKPADRVAGRVLLVQVYAAQHNQDRVKEQLAAIIEDLEQSKLATLTALAAHAAAEAIAVPELFAHAVPLLDKLSIDNQLRSITPPTGQHPVALLLRHYAQARNTAAARDLSERYTKSRQALFASVGSGDVDYYYRLDYAWNACELARCGDLKLTLSALARFADVAAPRDRDAPIAVAVWHLARQARQLAPAERYEQLRAWTLPTESRRSVRNVVGFDMGQPIPTLLTGPAACEHEPAPQFEAVSNLSLLVDAAAEAGRLDELWQTAVPLAAEKVPGAEQLAALAAIARGDQAEAASRLTAITERIAKETPESTAREFRPPLPDLADYLVMQAAAKAPALADSARRLGEALLDRGQKTGQKELIAHLGYDLARLAAHKLPPAEQAGAVTPNLAWWNPGTGRLATSGVYPPAVWAAHDGHLRHHSGCEYDALFFRYPLTGEFEFSYEAYTNYYAQGEAGYAGIFCFPRFNPGDTLIQSISLHETISLPGQIENRAGWNRRVVRVSPGRVQYFVNGHLAWDDKNPGPTSPWLTLHAQCERRPAFRNLRLSGSPQVPREVRLVDGNALDGWNPLFFGESMPRRLPDLRPAGEIANIDNRRTVLRPDGTYVILGPATDEAVDWSARDGVLVGKRDPDAGPLAQSLLYYQRPLESGERVKYQFLYEPGKKLVHPALGQIAFMLSPGGLELHWMDRDDANRHSPLAIPTHIAAADPASRRGAAALPLRPGEWNDVELTISGDELQVSLNGQLICQRPIEPTSTRRFGLFRYRGQTEAQVRNVVLTGDWPQSLRVDEIGDLTAVADSDDARPELLRARHASIGEGLLADSTWQVWQAGRGLPDDQRYDHFKNWVLPGADHPVLRLYADWTPTDPVPAAAESAEPAADSAVPAVGGNVASKTRRHSGGELVSPALDMVALAARLGKLDELDEEAKRLAAEYPDQERGLAALSALIAIAREDDALAESRLKVCQDYVARQPAETAVHARQAELLVGHAALARPKLAAATLALAEAIVNDQKRPRYVSLPWEQRARRLRSLAMWNSDPATRGMPFGNTAALGYWHPVNRPTAAARGLGVSPPAWRLTPEESTYLTGNARDALYCQVPLTGNYELRVTRGTNGWREFQPLVAGIAFDMDSAGLYVVRHEVGQPNGVNQKIPLKAKPAGWGEWVEQRIVVADGKLTVYIGEEQVHEELFPADADPWVAIEARQAHNRGAIRNIQILGTPVIPREVSLSAGAALLGWRADYYGETLGSHWTKEQEEIRASRLELADGSYRESLLQYHRPLIEDGSVEFEFYYEPGKFEVHPALDRLAFLIAPEGLKLHWLTDAQYERSGLSPDNARPLTGAAPIQLKTGDWNQLKLSLAGDEAKIEINGQVAGRHTIDAGNQRLLGLFRYQDKSGVRVRKVVLRGNWPDKLTEQGGHLSKGD